MTRKNDGTRLGRVFREPYEGKTKKKEKDIMHNRKEKREKHKEK